MPRTQEEARTYIPRQTRWQVLHDCHRVCAHCGTALTSTTSTLEHVIPLHKGGRNEMNNFVALCEACNKEKSDDIVEPKLYYPYLPKEKLKEVQTTFQNYIKTVRWLDYQTVFMTDRFDMPYRRFLPVNKANYRQIDVPATCRVQKLKDAAALELLMPYVAHLSVEDKSLIPLREQDIRSPFYGIYNGETLLALLQPYVEPQTIATPVHHDGPERPVLFLDFLPVYHQDIQLHNYQSYATILVSLLCEVQKTLRTLPDDAGIETLIRVPQSDKFGKSILDLLHYMEPEKYVLFLQHFGDDTETCAAILCADLILCQNHLKTINPNNAIATDWDHFQNTLTQTGRELAKLQKPVQSELELTEAPKARKKPLTKSQKKRKHSKKNNKRYKNG